MQEEERHNSIEVKYLPTTSWKLQRNLNSTLDSNLQIQTSIKLVYSN